MPNDYSLSVFNIIYEIFMTYNQFIKRLYYHYRNTFKLNLILNLFSKVKKDLVIIVSSCLKYRWNVKENVKKLLIYKTGVCLLLTLLNISISIENI